MLYTYTSVDSFIGMNQTARDHGMKDSLVFWASSVYVMNDPTEFKYGRALAMNYLRRYEESANIPPHQRLSTSFDDYELTSKEYGSKYDVYNFYLNNNLKTPFAISFTKSEDDLFMWNMYGDKGFGLCLGFEIQTRLSEDDESEEILYDINYSGKIDEDQKILKKFLYFYEKWSDKVTNTCIEEKLVTRMMGASVVTGAIAPLLKKSSYSKEQEVRLLDYLDEMDELKFRSRNSKIIPFKEICIKLNALKKIIIGPCCDKSQMHQNVNFVLNSRGLNLDICKQADVEVVSSKILYRSI